ncbi:MAG: DUF5995 family protein [Humibacillus sp.]|nr:DUF5995 family protein [Humibacillus sp.]MDN5778282.1 DUF5995 family protein [Humibacillus sp.]
MGWLTHLIDVIRGRSRLRKDAPPPGQLPSIDAVCERMRQIALPMAPGDGLGAFNGMYLTVTELVRDRISQGYFGSAEVMTRFDIVFAGMYLEAVDATAPSSAWVPVFEARHESGRLPIQFALAGMNAHINHDLPIALVATCRQLGLGPDSPGVEADYQKVTDLLADAQEQVRESFLQGIALDVDRRYAGPVANLVSSWSIGRARDAAWVNAGVLWRLDGVEPLCQDFLTTLSSSVGMAGRVLLTPVADLG